MTTQTLTQGRVRWVNIVQPSAGDLEQLGCAYPQFHELNLQDCLSTLEYPKVDHHDDYLFLVMHFPTFEHVERISAANEIDVFIADDLLVTAHQGHLAPLNELWDACARDEAEREQAMGRGASPLLYALLNRLVDYCYPIVRKVDVNVRAIEMRLFKESPRRVIAEIAVVRRDLIALRRILHPQHAIFRELEEGSWPWIRAELDVYWHDLSEHIGQLCAMLDDDSDVISGLADTIDTLASHRIDEVVRVLTLATITTLPITVLSTIYSMNVYVPGKEYPATFFAVVLLGLLITAGALWYLRSKDWL